MMNFRSDNVSQSNSSFYLSAAEEKRPETSQQQRILENKTVPERIERVSKQSENKQILIEEKPKENPRPVSSSTTKTVDPSVNDNIDFIVDFPRKI